MGGVPLASEERQAPDGGEVRHAPEDPVEPKGARRDAPAEAETDVQLDQFRVLSLVAHELRGPLHALTTSSELLLEDLEVLKPPDLRNMVSAIHRRALWLQGLVENLLADAALREGGFRIHPRPGNLMELVLEVQSVVDPLLEQKNQKIRLWSTPEMPDALMDSRSIGQVLINLIVNASKFSPRATIIDVTLTVHHTSPNDTGLRVTVADRGPGIPPGEETSLFEPFVRGAEVEQTSKEGLGLGLSITKSIVETHGGQVGVENRRGGGARFWFEIPAAGVISDGALGGPAEVLDDVNGAAVGAARGAAVSENLEENGQ